MCLIPDTEFLGVGYHNYQAQPPLPSSRKHFQAFPEILVNNGLTNIEALSMWLDSEDTGYVLYRGVDRAKYFGDLVAVPIVKDPKCRIMRFCNQAAESRLFPQKRQINDFL